MMDVNVFDSANDVVVYLAEDLMRYSLSDQIVHIALSGGSTPKQLFQYLAENDDATRINWQDLHFWWGDERCVEADSAESNYGEAYELLFRHVAIPSGNLHRIRGEADPVIEKERYRSELKKYLPIKFGRPQFDWVLLGVGEDGHTASLFPGQTDYATDEGVVVADHPLSGQKRISLAVPVIRMAKRLTYLVTGISKADILKTILEQEDGCDALPAAKISSTEGQTEWCLDREAASKLSTLI